MPDLLKQIFFERMAKLIGKPLPSMMDMAIPQIIAQIKQEKQIHDMNVMFQNLEKEQVIEEHGT